MADAPTERSPEQRAAERGERRRATAAARRRWRERARKTGADRAPGLVPEPDERPRARPRMRQGVVVSDRADKTIVVRIDTARGHRVYQKIVRESSRLHAHDERNEAHAGDTVRVVESRPMSRTKRWRLIEIVERAR